MVGVLDAVGLTALVTSIPGLSAVGAAVILAETGDLARFASSRSVVKHAGLNPAENTSGTFRNIRKVSRRGRTRTTGDRLAGRVGRAAHQPDPVGQVHPPDQS